MLAQKLTESWRQQVIVDNRAGGAGVIGVQLAASAAPDGYTLLFASSSTFASAPNLTPNLPYHPLRDFAPVTLAILGPNILTAHPSLPVQSLKQLIALAKANPGKITFASIAPAATGARSRCSAPVSPGIATASHMAGVLFNRGAGINLLHVPYKGGGVAVNDVVGGHVHLLFGSVSTSIALVRSGKLRALAVTSAKRVSAVPEIPTMAESGLPGYEVVQWFGIALPAGASRPIIIKLNQVLVAILSSADVAESFVKRGLEPVGSTPDVFAAYIQSELAKWSRLFKDAGLSAEQVR
jgi:tripartite-type tricarboxylate transporter receptor subunit TctC